MNTAPITNPIRRTAFIGMGALGLLFAQPIADTLGEGSVTFLMDEDRLKRHSQDTYTINGQKRIFPMADIAKAEPFDLVVVAVKYGALPETIESMAPAIGPDTVIISVMNGITSEDMLAKVYPRSQIIDCVAIGMDAMRDGTSLQYTKFGRLQIGISDPSQTESYARLVDLFERTGMPHECMDNIRQAMWNKFMLNVGINQACTAYDTDYQHCTTPGPIFDEMVCAMKEVVALANASGISLTDEHVNACIAIEKTLKPDGYPSMRQDTVAHRKTELGMFAGTVIELGKKLGIPTPVNEKYQDMIRAIEAKF